MRPRQLAPVAALAILAALPGTAAARPAIEFTPGPLRVISASCTDYLALREVSWTGSTANGATQVTGTWTTPGTLDTVTGDSSYGWRPPEHDGTMLILFGGQFPAGSRIGSVVTLLNGGRPLTVTGRALATTFVDGGVCSPD